MKTPQYKDSSKLVPLCLFMDSVIYAFYSCGGEAINPTDQGYRKLYFRNTFEKEARKVRITEINLN